MRRFAVILLYILMIIFFSCEEQGWFADCSLCTTYEPDAGSLSVMTSESLNDVIINIYEGEIEDSIIYASFYISGNGDETNYQVVLNKKYCVTATYTIEGNIYTAFDSATPRVKFTDDQCDEPCYFVYDRVVDLRLKYTAGAAR